MPTKPPVIVTATVDGLTVDAKGVKIAVTLNQPEKVQLATELLAPARVEQKRDVPEPRQLDLFYHHLRGSHA